MRYISTCACAFPFSVSRVRLEGLCWKMLPIWDLGGYSPATRVIQVMDGVPITALAQSRATREHSIVLWYAVQPIYYGSYTAISKVYMHIRECNCTSFYTFLVTFARSSPKPHLTGVRNYHRMRATPMALVKNVYFCDVSLLVFGLGDCRAWLHETTAFYRKVYRLWRIGVNWKHCYICLAI